MALRPGGWCCLPRGGRRRLRRPRTPSGRQCRGAGAPRVLPASPPCSGTRAPAPWSPPCLRTPAAGWLRQRWIPEPRI
eukprot:1306293-Alexandrium_andersonii.AAC.1